MDDPSKQSSLKTAKLNPSYMPVKRVGPGERLKGRRVAIIAANEFEDIELLYPLLRPVSYTHLTLPTTERV